MPTNMLIACDRWIVYAKVCLIDTSCVFVVCGNQVQVSITYWTLAEPDGSVQSIADSGPL